MPEVLRVRATGLRALLVAPAFRPFWAEVVLRLGVAGGAVVPSGPYGVPHGLGVVGVLSNPLAIVGAQLVDLRSREAASTPKFFLFLLVEKARF